MILPLSMPAPYLCPCVCALGRLFKFFQSFKFDYPECMVPKQNGKAGAKKMKTNKTRGPEKEKFLDQHHASVDFKEIERLKKEIFKLEKYIDKMFNNESSGSKPSSKPHFKKEADDKKKVARRKPAAQHDQFPRATEGARQTRNLSKKQRQNLFLEAERLLNESEEFSNALLEEIEAAEGPLSNDTIDFEYLSVETCLRIMSLIKQHKTKGGVRETRKPAKRNLSQQIKQEHLNDKSSDDSSESSSDDD